ncbi:MAG: nuclear transport factor 2 family protein [Hyphomonadaceae bacterium]
MSKENVALIKGLYEAFAAGDAGAVLAKMSPAIVWNEAENFPYADGNPYVGPEAVANGVFARIGADWEGFAITVENLLDAGEAVVVQARYRGVFKATGKRLDAQAAHVWRLADGKVASFQQYVDTLQAARVAER